MWGTQTPPCLLRGVILSVPSSKSTTSLLALAKCWLRLGFLSGKAWDWWAGMQTSRRYLDMGGLEEFFQAVAIPVSAPHDAHEQNIDRWCTVRQKHDVHVIYGLDRFLASYNGAG